MYINYVEAMRLICALGLVSLSKTLPKISQFPTIQKQTDLGTNELHFLQKEDVFFWIHPLVSHIMLSTNGKQKIAIVFCVRDSGSIVEHLHKMVRMLLTQHLLTFIFTTNLHHFKKLGPVGVV